MRDAIGSVSGMFYQMRGTQVRQVILFSGNRPEYFSLKRRTKFWAVDEQRDEREAAVGVAAVISGGF